MSKVIEINDGGYVWHVPLMAIAKNRADFYADRGEQDNEGEIRFVMEDSYEGIDWFLNNMDFSDIASQTTFIKGPPPKIEPDMFGENTTTTIVEVNQ